jgi:hypothetical protein
MQCPKCGYVMGPFDVECERCKRMPSTPVPSTPPLLLSERDRPTVPQARYKPQARPLRRQSADAPPEPSGTPAEGIPLGGGYVLRSGFDNVTPIPMEVTEMGWCWGGFVFTWIWGICNNVLLGLVALVPAANLVISVWLGLKGHELAWQCRHFEDFEQYKHTMEAWNQTGIVILVISAVVGVIMGFIVSGEADFRPWQRNRVDPSSALPSHPSWLVVTRGPSAAPARRRRGPQGTPSSAGATASGAAHTRRAPTGRDILAGLP